MKSTPESSGVDIARAELLAPEIQALIAALNSELSDRYPEEGANHFRLDPEEVAEDRGAVLLAHRGCVPIACGAVRLLDGHTAEIKRMYVVPDQRGHGVGALVLAGLEKLALQLGAARLVLETGERQIEALALYRRAGFAYMERFGEYESSPLSVCMEKKL